MELDQPHLQLIFNVIAITAVTSLAAICYLLKRDNQELSASQFDPPRGQEPQPPRNLAPPPPAVAKTQPHAAPQLVTQQVATPPRVVEAPPAPRALPLPEARLQAQAPPARDTDISRFVAQRAQGWVAPSESQWKTP
jgi:hypothetical protein